MRWTPNSPEYFQWHRWFAWYPVQVGDTWVWLETVERVRVFIGPTLLPNTRRRWRYREVDEG